MAPRTKKLASKRPRETREPSLEALEFTVPENHVRFEHLLKLKFGQSRIINGRILEEIGLADDVRELVFVGSWNRLLTI